MKRWLVLSQTAPKGSLILDIGAYHGEYACAARTANKGVRIVAFEPNPTNAHVLRQNCEALAIDVFEAAVSSACGVQRFSLADARSGIQVNDTGIELVGDTCEVETVRLDDWLTHHGGEVHLMKIDVEGYEAEVLTGAMDMLNRSQPIILCEVLSDDAGEQVMKLLPPSYTYYYINENHGIQRRENVTRHEWRNKNWLFVPVSKAQLLGEHS